jgi:GxxExxY protein
MINEQYKDSALTSKIIGCAMAVHNTIGCGFQEVIYQRALAIELQKADIIFQREVEMSIFYDNNLIGTRRVDFLIQGTVLVELKAVLQLEDSHFAQAINYLEVFKLEVGLLINFGAKKMQFRRLMKTRL